MTHSQAARTQPRDTKRWRRVSCSQTGLTLHLLMEKPTEGLTQMSESHAWTCTSGHPLLSQHSSFPPVSQCWVGNERLFPIAIPFSLKKRWLSARNPLDHCHILLSDQTTAGGRQLTDQHLFKWKTWVGSPRDATFCIARMILQPLPPPWQGVSSLHQHFSDGLSHTVVL